MTTEYPTIRATIDALKSIITGPFRICWWYSGSDDSGWFDGFQAYDHDDVAISKDAVIELIAGNADKIERELETILGSRFPGWEIGDGHVRGSHGWFDILSTGTIKQKHHIDYEESDDMSPNEEITF